MSSAVVTLSDEELLAALTDLETRRRTLAADEHALIAEAESRHLAQERGMRSTAVLLNRLLRITPAEASARVKAAADIGPRRGLTGEQLPPIYPHVAAAQAEGAISVAHAKLIVDVVSQLPDHLDRATEEQVEKDLVEHARRYDPRTVGLLARRIVAHLDPDGMLENVEARHRGRFLRVHRRADGSAFGSFELDVECAEYLQVALTALSGPKPAVEGIPDPRSGGQRAHDGLLELCKLGMRARQLPSTGGVTTTVLIHATPQSLTGTGLVSTGTGALIPAAEANRWASSDSRFVGYLINQATRVTTYSPPVRLFTEGQRLALIARDQGCSFPGCTTPPALCQAHHIDEWANHGPTAVENGTLLCGYHHREFEASGWSCRMLDGTPHWIAPSWLDHAQTPQRNHAHDPLAVT